MADVGMNLAAVNYYSSEYPFIDRMKSASGWAVQGSNDALSLDANGYPQAMPNGAARIYTMVSIDPASAGTDKDYVLTYTGKATIRLAAEGTSIVSSEPGKIVFRVTGNSTTAPLVISDIDPKNPITSLSLVRQDQVALHDAGEIFNPAFLEKTTGFDTLRFMDWGATNHSTLTSWADRTHVSDMSWAANDSKSGVPIEVMVALSNKTKADMWLNIPAQADDNYVRKTLEYVKANLDPTLRVNLEYSNEVWNWNFAQSKYARAMADQLWGKDVNGDGAIDSNNPAEAVAGGFQVYYGYRAAQVAKIGNDIFGKDSAQFAMVLGAQVVNRGLENYIVDGVAKANVGSVSDLFDSYAVTSYFGDTLNGVTAADRTKILEWAKSGAAGLSAAFQEMEKGGSLSGLGSIASLMPFFTYAAGVAEKYGLDLVSYEGGLSLAASAFDKADQATIMDFFNRLQADPRMGLLYDKLVSAFESAGGKMVNVYADAMTDRVHGIFGTLDSIYDTSPAHEALKALATSAGAGKSPALAAGQAVSDPADRTTTSNSYALGSGEAAIRFVGTGAFTATGNAMANTITGGDGGNKLSGAGGADKLIGGKGDDVLDGGSGADTMIGGKGDDVYIVDNAGDVVVEKPGEGIDEIRTSLASYTLVDEVEKLTYTGVGAFTGTGNALDNVLSGGDGGAKLYGGAGNDTLIGGKGADWLDGGTGRDTMSGGAGNDTYIVDDIGDVVVEKPGEGVDLVRTTLAGYTLGAEVENLIYDGAGMFIGRGNALANVITAGDGGSQLFGDAGNDTLIGGDGKDVLDGGTGADRMTGGKGDDTYVVDHAGDRVIELAGEGIDTVRTTLAVYALPDNVEKLVFAGTGNWTGSGNALDNEIVGGDGVNRLYGGDGNDTLQGGTSDDLLDGGTGADRMVGGKGNDVYYVDNAGDRVIEDVGGGNDTVFASITYTLSPNVETLRLAGTAAINGTGNDLNNMIVGNSADNRIAGGKGDDTIWGKEGNDFLDGGSGNDSLMGDEGDDKLMGGAGNDILNGGAGNDILVGGEGIDTLTGGSGADRFVFGPSDLGTSSAATDKILDFSRAEGDKIDLRTFDANVRTAVDDAFSFIGAGAFTKVAGQLRAEAWGSYWSVQGDTNGDGVADFVLNVSRGSGTLIASDFLL